MASIVEGYVTGYRAAADALRVRMRELESREYPTALSKTLLRTLDRAVAASLEVVDSLATSNNDTVETAILRHGHLLTYLHQFVHVVASSVGADVPRWAIEPMKFEIRRFFNEPVDVLIVGSQEGGNFAFDYRLDKLRSVLSKAFGDDLTNEITAELPAHMAVFHFPFGERDNVMVHGAFFHEVGHQIDVGVRGTSERVAQDFFTKKDVKIRKEIRKIIGPTLQKAFGGDKPTEDMIVEATLASIQKTLYRWAREVCADLLATRILGPAYALVIVTSPALQATLRQHSASHPATLLRLCLALELLGEPRTGDFIRGCETALDQAGVGRLLMDWQKRCKESIGGFTWNPGMGIPPQGKLEAYAAALGEELGRNVLTAVISETASQDYYTPEEYERGITNDLPMLEAGFTINERIDPSARAATPNSISTIYNVGMACYLRHQTPGERERITKLIRKSIELSQVQRALALGAD